MFSTMNPSLWTFQAPRPFNLFFAALPPEWTCSTMETLGRTVQKAHGLRGRPVTGGRLHSTIAAVHDPCYLPHQVLERAKVVGARVRHPSFSIRFDWMGSFDVHRNRYPLVLRGGAGLQSLIGFQQEIGMQMKRAGFDVASSYTPHVTLLWADRPVADYPIAPIAWTVTDFVLVASEVGETRHIHVARWPLK